MATVISFATCGLNRKDDGLLPYWYHDQFMRGQAPFLWYIDTAFRAELPTTSISTGTKGSLG